MGMEDEDIDALLAPHPINGGTAGITAGGADNIHALAALLKEILKDITQKLQGNILKGQGGAMEEFQDMDLTPPDQRGNIGMTEGGVGALDNPLEIMGRDIRGEKSDHLKGEVGKLEALPFCYGLRGDNRDGFRKQEAAIPGKTHHHRLFKTDGLYTAPRTDIFHWPFVFRS